MRQVKSPYEQREYWVDPFNPNVWEYNADIAEELQELGVDEIQFDYIRFPSDGDTSRISFTSSRPGMTRINALESFFRLVRERVHIPISTDLYGFNSYYRMGNWIRSEYRNACRLCRCNLPDVLSFSFSQ